MPEWSKPPAQVLDDALMNVWNDLNDEVGNNPSFDTVVGLQPSQLTNHAALAVATYLASEKVELSSPESLIHLYTLGFVVGMKYGEARQGQSADHIT